MRSTHLIVRPRIACGVAGVGPEALDGSCHQDERVGFWFVIVVLGNCLVSGVGFLQAKINGHGMGQVEERAVVWDDS